MTWYVYLQAFAWSYLLLKVNEVVERRLEQILWLQTQANVDFFKFISNFLLGDLKKRVSQSDYSDFRALEKFSLAFHDMKCVFGRLLMIIPICQSKQSGRTTCRSVSTGGNARQWWFLENHTQILVPPLLFTSKRGFHKVTTVTSGPSKKFSVGFYNMEFIFASILMIISIFQSKRRGRTTLRTDSTVANARKWWFFQVYTNNFGTSIRDLKWATPENYEVSSNFTRH